MKQICHFERSVAMTANVFGLGEGRELELQNFKFSTNDK